MTRTVWFIQLPQLDNDVSGAHENVPLAAAYLQHAAERAGEDGHYRFERLPAGLESADTPTLAAFLTARAPDVLAVSLYLWNIERSLRLARAVKARSPRTRVVVGGPEAARHHPFLFRAGTADAVVVGEGEVVFPEILRAWRTNGTVDAATVAWRTARGYRWGRRAPREIDLCEALPPPVHAACRPDDRGMAYLETSRGCPFRCTYCRYPHLRRRMTFLPPEDVVARVGALQGFGAKEIRFVDPTFNAHPRFREVLRQLAAINRRHTLAFFLELTAERVTEADADALAAAHVTEVEVGLQSRDADVLRAIRRPTDVRALEAGVRRLTRRGIRVTLDLMYGLPLQRLADLRAALPWAAGRRGVDVQCLQTLLLPGTELRDRRREWGIVAAAKPPYAVQSTSTMTSDDFRRVEDLVERDPRLRSDIRTRRFVGRSLPDLFPEEVRIGLANWRADQAIPGTGNRRAVVFAGPELFAARARIAAVIRQAIRQDPDMLWQFVLEPAGEEPLDLFDALAAVVCRQPAHLLDRYAAAALRGRVASRRMLVRLPPRRRFDPGWVAAVEDVLAGVFF
jgi:radical SAM superfamily enzyme YgiQ (UPF0313 family)